MTKKRRTRKARRRTVGWRVRSDIYDRVTALCEDLRFKPKRWKKGCFAEAALRMLLAHSSPSQTILVENAGNEDFWKEYEKEVRRQERELLSFLSEGE